MLLLPLPALPKPSLYHRSKGPRSPHASREQKILDTTMDSSRRLALPPELRVMIYAYLGPPTIAHERDYCGLRQTCRLLRNEYDGETVRLLRRAYQHANPANSITLSGPDLRSLELKIQHDSLELQHGESRLLPDFHCFALRL